MVFFISLKTARSIGDTIRSGKQEYRENTVLQDKVVLLIIVMDSYWIYESSSNFCLKLTKLTNYSGPTSILWVCFGPAVVVRINLLHAIPALPGSTPAVGHPCTNNDIPRQHNGFELEFLQ